MDAPNTFAFIATLWLLVSIVWAGLLVRSGRALASVFQQQHPEVYGGEGRPRPGFIDGDRRRAWTQFMVREKYKRLGDDVLIQQFDRFRHAEKWFLVSTLSGAVALTAIGLWLRFFA